MRHRRGLVVCIAVTMAILLFTWTAPSLMAKGSSLETEKRGYRPGEIAVARATFSATPYADGAVSDGPFEAYLVPYSKPLEPGPIPNYAVPLGELRMTPTGNRVWEAVIEFKVPKVDSGLYKLDYCNVPCTVWGIEELSAGSFVVLETVQEARFDNLQAAIERLRQQVQDLASALAASDETANQLAADFRKLKADTEDSPPWLLPPVGVAIAALFSLMALVLGARNKKQVQRLLRSARTPQEDASQAVPPRVPARS